MAHTNPAAHTIKVGAGFLNESESLFQFKNYRNQSFI